MAVPTVWARQNAACCRRRQSHKTRGCPLSDSGGRDAPANLRPCGIQAALHIFSEETRRRGKMLAIFKGDLIVLSDILDP